MGDGDLLGEIKAILRSLLISSTDALSAEKLNKDFRESEGIYIPYRKLGYSSLELLLRSPILHDTLVVDNFGYVRAIVSKKTEHMDKLISKQKVTKKKNGYGQSRPRAHNIRPFETTRYQQSAPPRVNYPKMNNPLLQQPPPLMQQFIPSQVQYNYGFRPLNNNALHHPLLNNNSMHGRYQVNNNIYTQVNQSHYASSNNYSNPVPVQYYTGKSFQQIQFPKNDQNHYYKNNQRAPNNNNFQPYNHQNQQKQDIKSSDNTRSNKGPDYSELIPVKTNVRPPPYNLNNQPDHSELIPVKTNIRPPPPTTDESGSSHSLQINSCSEMTAEEIFSRLNPNPNELDTLSTTLKSSLHLHAGKTEELKETERPSPLSETPSKDVSSVPDLEVSDPILNFNITPNMIRYAVRVLSPLLPDDVCSGSQFTIYISDIASPNRFWFQMVKTANILHDLMNQLQAFYCQLEENELRLHPNDFRDGQYCVAKYLDFWHRGQIKGDIEDGQAKIFFLDYGTVDMIPLKYLKYMKLEFSRERALAFRGGMAEVEPAHSNGWTDDSRKFFSGMVFSEPVTATVVHANRENHFVSMRIYKEGARDISINDMMIKRGSGKFCKTIQN